MRCVRTKTAPLNTPRAFAAPIFAAVVSALLLFSFCADPAHAQSALKANTIVEGLADLGNAENVDVPALRAAALDRIRKARTSADRNPVNRPPIAEALLRFPQVTLEIAFKEDSSTIAPASYPMLGRVADALYHPHLLDRRFLLAAHTASDGKRQDNLILSQKRADAIRDALVTVFRVSPKRIEAIGFGEEQLQDRRNPKAGVNQRVQLIVMGKVVRDAPTAAPHASPSPAVKRGRIKP